jgi:hypothetical protein
MGRSQINLVTKMKWASVSISLIVAIASFKWISISLWLDMNQGLLAFLGLLAASLVQVIPVTANFLQADKLTPSEAMRLSDQLAKQQRYWIGLLAATLLTFAVVLIASVLKDRTMLEIPTFGKFDVGPSWSAALAFSITFVLVKMIGLFDGVISLQQLRSELVLNEAKRNAAEQVEKAQAELIVPQNITPSDYGRIIRPH